MEKFLEDMRLKGKSENTLKAYESDIKTLEKFLQEEEKELSLESLLLYKEYLYKNFKSSTASRKLILANKYFTFTTGEKSEITPTKVQRTIKEFMSKNDYDRVMRQVEKAEDRQIALIMQTLAYTGIRYSELQFVTVEALNKKELLINNKGTIRVVPLMDFLVKDLKKYIKDLGIKKGIVFINRNGNLYDHVSFFKKLKRYAGLARVKKEKITPHGLRHLFAKNYLELEETSIMDLADLLGHKSLDTTRIYTTKSSSEHRKTLNKMKDKK